MVSRIKEDNYENTQLLVLRSSLKIHHSPTLVSLWSLGGHIIGEGRSLELLPPGHFGPLLHLVVGENVLVRGAGDGKRVKGVHLTHVPEKRLVSKAF